MGSAAPKGPGSSLRAQERVPNDPDEHRRVAALCEHIKGDTHHQHAIQQKARHYAGQLAAAALAEQASAPQALRSLADAIDRAATEAPAA